MKKPLLRPLLRPQVLPLWLALACAPALADWVRISSSDTSVFYIDSVVSPKVGSNVTVWVMRDHTAQQVGAGGPYLSSKDQLEMDCDGRRVRRIYTADYAEHLGKGKMAHFEYGPMSWNAVAPDTIIRRMVDMACVVPQK